MKLNLIPGLNNGELNKGLLAQQMNNPSLNVRDREILSAILGNFNPQNAGNAPQENNLVPPAMPNNVRKIISANILPSMNK